MVGDQPAGGSRAGTTTAAGVSSPGTVEAASLAVGARVFVVPDPTADLGWVGAVRKVDGARLWIAAPPSPDGVPALAPGVTVRIAKRDGKTISLVAAQVVGASEGAIEMRTLGREVAAERAPRPVSRKHLRAVLCTPCEVDVEGVARAGAWAADLGAGGAELVLPEEDGVVKAGARGVCALAMPGEEPWSLAFRVVRVRREEGVGLRVGVAFVELGAEMESRIDAFVMFVRRTRLTRLPP